ncbi:LacI family DNA-binding transcriptional regulator [Motilibacter aurantiacus]|uniref:LacI family DNA-binding transcriptional regulator n=1 Tax=Motilibacter aurantiacus TaxID=2714955 RepID=UPI002F2B3E52
MPAGRPPEPPRQRPTLSRIAQIAGVSVPTVSKVVNGRADVGPDTRSRVERALREHGYRPARKLGAPGAHIELVFHALESAYDTEVINGAEQVASENGLALVISQLNYRFTPGSVEMERVLSRRPAGVISVFSGLGAEQRRQLRDRDIAYVVVDPTEDPGPDFPTVAARNWHGGALATQHLLDLGHRRIAAVTGPLWALPARARLDGYTAALRRAGLALDPALVREDDFVPRGGREQAQALLQLPDRPTAVVAGNDGQALGVCQAAQEAGLRVPQDLSVVGFDDLSIAASSVPPLTTVHQPIREMAAAAAGIVVRQAAGVPLTESRVELPVELVVRASTQPPRGG